MENRVKGSVWQARKAPVDHGRFNSMRLRIAISIFLDSFLKGCGALFGTAHSPAYSGRK
ncbi:hypothetical protein OR1_01239 [Geobacter sp. OR-1]|uniref:hypothetical protein n=1 Tax=Geobacter sp. OR-1 TaxID=1266765 RepID=UPI000541C267|nr:hypothetical protein [Geobacter sp. OR-1]GAM08965.1 hypothetical protein OR1_01239 [Geobacter sp. OR-1]